MKFKIKKVDNRIVKNMLEDEKPKKANDSAEHSFTSVIQLDENFAQRWNKSINGNSLYLTLEGEGWRLTVETSVYEFVSFSDSDEDIDIIDSITDEMINDVLGGTTEDVFIELW